LKIERSIPSSSWVLPWVPVWLPALVLVPDELQAPA
jgi:hypothetical protein